MNIKKYIDEFKYIGVFVIGIIAFTLVISILTVNSKEISVSAKDNTVNQKENVIKNNTIKINGDSTIRVYITSEDKVEEVPIEDYICGVVANEMPISFNEEALKAQAVASRTYLASKLVNKCSLCDNADICDSTHCQVYTSKEKRMESWDNNKANEYWDKIVSAVNATEGEVLSYNGELVLYPQFFSTSSGKTENSEDTNWGSIPYLRSVESPGEEVAPKFTSENEISIAKLVAKVNEKYPNSGVNINNASSVISVVSRSDSGSVKEIKIGNDTITGSEFRFLVGLNSSNFTYNFSGDNVTFNCRGYGHGVGMSQWGANVMGKSGKKYDEILKHYYTGVEISKLIFE